MNATINICYTVSEDKNKQTKKKLRCNTAT